MPSDTAIRFGVHRIKMLSYVRQLNYILPADSFIEECVRAILLFAEQSEEDQQRELALFWRTPGLVKRKEPVLEED